VGSPLTAEQLQLTQFWLQDLGFGNHNIAFEFFRGTRTSNKRYGYCDAEVWEKTKGLGGDSNVQNLP